MRSRFFAGWCASIAVGAAIAACDSVQPTGSKLITDVPPLPDASTGEDASQPAFEAGPPVEGGLDASYTPVDANLGACSGCICSASSSYCFAGATPRAPVDAGDAGPPACTVATSSTPEVGCNALPAACAAAPDCACIIDTLQPAFRCYLNCTHTSDGFLVYCPNP